MAKIMSVNFDRETLAAGFEHSFGSGGALSFFSAPGRVELLGNHTDHQLGRVLAAAIELDMRAAARINPDGVIRVCSEGFSAVRVDLKNLSPLENERFTTSSLVRGIAARICELGYEIGGFDMYIRSDVPVGSGLSSSAAFETLVGCTVNSLYCSGGISARQIAEIGQFAENRYFGKQSGLMDQTASSIGGIVYIDFKSGSVEKLSFDFSACGHKLCVIAVGDDHADLSDEYSAIPAEMRAVASALGGTVLSDSARCDFESALPALRVSCGDRAVLRAMHYYTETERVAEAAEALKRGDFGRFLSCVNGSGRSSEALLQNIIPSGAVGSQSVALALARCSEILGGLGAYRVHGGGFAGTVLAIVPDHLLAHFIKETERVFGPGSCRILNVRPYGGGTHPVSAVITDNTTTSHSRQTDKT
jgi:galactokinase